MSLCYDEEKDVQTHSGDVTVEGSDDVSSTIEDRDLGQFGYKPELKRRFGFWSMVGFSCVTMITWEGILPTLNVGLQDGGPAGLVYGFLFAWLGWTAIIASLSELVSIIPTAGGQYHWAYCFAPAKYRRHISWITGWQVFCAWQADLAAVFYLGGIIVQGLLVLNYPDYNFQRWHGTLLFWAITVVAVIFNTLLVRLMPWVEASIGVIHVLGFLIVLIPMVHLGNKVTAYDVFVQYLTIGGYSPGLSWLVGLISTVFGFMAADGGIHLSEEVRNARVTVPRSLVWSVFINGLLGFGFLIGFLFVIGDVKEALDAETGFVFIGVFQQALHSTRFATGFVALFVVLFVACAIAVLAATSRVTWALARDDALPGSSWIKKVEPRTKIPINAILLSGVISMLLGLINIGSSVAFNAIVSLVAAAFFGSYFIPIAIIVHRRLQHVPLELGPWNLGRFGLVTNVFALTWLVICFTFSFFPIAVPVDPETMNWSCVIWGGAMIFGVIWYWVFQRHRFRGPTVVMASD